MPKYRRSFTLAELIMILTLVGVIAATSLPTLIHNIQTTSYKILYKKAFSTASQAWTKALADNLLKARSAQQDWTANPANFDSFKSKFNVIKDCPMYSDLQVCWEMDSEKFNYWSPDSSSQSFIDASGMAWITQQIWKGSFLFYSINL
ncbi:MAG: hypothetical protein V2B14_03985 [bacterium]